MSIVKLSNNGVKNATAFGSAVTSLGSMTFIKKLTASSSATLSFVDGASSVVLDNTYKEYLFTFKDIHPQTDGVKFQVGFRDGGTDYDATKTTTIFQNWHAEDGSETALNYDTGEDIAQGTGFQTMTGGDSLGSDNDQCIVGTLHLFNPSSTTFVKHFIARTNFSGNNNFSVNAHIAGYCNTTTAIDGVQFSFSSGNIDAGTFKLYGIKDS